MIEDVESREKRHNYEENRTTREVETEPQERNRTKNKNLSEGN